MTKEILIILPHNPGDVVMALQAIAKIKSAWIDFEFDYVVGEECSGLVENCLLIRKSYVIPKSTLKAHWNRGAADLATQEVSEFLFSIATTRYTLSLNLFQEKWGGIIQSFVDAEIKFGLELKAEGNLSVTSRILEHLMAIPANRAANGWHVVDIYIRAFEEAMAIKGLTKNVNTITSPNLNPNPTPALGQPLWKKPSSDLLQPHSLKAKKFIALHPGSAWIGKRWPEKKWSRLIELLAADGSKIVITGAKEELTCAESILAKVTPTQLNSVVNLVGKTTLLELGEILAQAKLLVTGDTVAMHLAAANHTAVVALFGASNPIETGPYGRGNVIFQTEPQLKLNLEFSQKNQGLEILSAEAVANFILTGTQPKNVEVWQTAWDANMHIQILKNFKQETWRPTQLGQALQAVLTPQPTRDPEILTATLSPTQNQLFTQLNTALENPTEHLTEQFLRAMDQSDQRLAFETEADLIWEAYRIHVNSLTMVNLLTFLIHKRSRLLQALGEIQSVAKALP